MRVLIINKFLYPNGGSETYIFKLGEALEQHGHEVQYFGMEHEGRCVGNRVNLEGGDCVVSWCLGYLAEYAAPEYYDERYKSWRFDDLPILPEEWKLLVSEDKKAHFNILRKLLRSKDFDYVVNACDAG